MTYIFLESLWLVPKKPPKKEGDGVTRATSAGSRRCAASGKCSVSVGILGSLSHFKARGPSTYLCKFPQQHHYR